MQNEEQLRNISSIPDEFQYPGIEVRGLIHKDEGHEIHMASNIADVVRATANGTKGISGIFAYDFRLLASQMPGQGQKVVFHMAPTQFSEAELDMFYELVEKAGLSRDQFQVVIHTSEGMKSPEEFLQNPNDANYTEVQMINDLDVITAEKGGIKLNLMMSMSEIMGRSREEWEAKGIVLTEDTTGLDKAVVRRAVEESGEGDALACGVTVFNRNAVEDKLMKRQSDKRGVTIGEDEVLISSENMEHALMFMKQKILECLEKFDGKVVVKYAGGHSGVGNKFIDLNREGYDFETDFNNFNIGKKSLPLGAYLVEGINQNESFVIEQAIDMLEDPDGNVEIAVRGYVTDEGEFILTSTHRVVTVQEGESRGKYLGVIIANDTRKLVADDSAAEIIQDANKKMQRLAGVMHSRFRYTGPLNKDAIVDQNGKAFFADLNNAREGGSSASSSIFAMMVEAVRNNKEIKFGELLSTENPDVNDLGLIDIDLELEGDMSVNWDLIVKELQLKGVYPYCTTTLYQPDGGIVKLKVSVPFEFSALDKNKSNEGKLKFLETQVMKIVSTVVSTHNLAVHKH
jgi:hypothetical protein